MESVLRQIVEVLSRHVEDVAPVSESDIRLFVQDRNIPIHEDHVRFLMNFGGEVDDGLRIFEWYGGDFSFDSFKRVYIQNHPDMRTPEGNVFFGGTIVGDTLCVDCKSGKVYAYDEGDGYGLVHESIDGFILRCLVSVYYEKLFSSGDVALDVEPSRLNKFRAENAINRIVEADAFRITYVNIDKPVAIAEYYWADNKLIAVYPTTNSMVTYSGGVLDVIDKS